MEDHFYRQLGNYYNRLLDEKAKAEINGDSEKAVEIQKEIDKIHETF